MDESVHEQAHEALNYLRSWHDGDTRFMDRVAKLEAYVAGLELTSFGYTVGPYTGVLPPADITGRTHTVFLGRSASLPVEEATDPAEPGPSEVVSEVAVESDGGLMTTANTFADPVPDNQPTPEEVIAQAESIMAELPEEIGGKKKAKK